MHYQSAAGYAALEKLGERTWMLLILKVEKGKRGKGHGAALLTRILRDADTTRTTIRLCVPSHTYQGDMSPEQLLDWYRGYGFRPRGVNLIRRPRKVKSNAH